jgi:hypothetical protein
MARTPKPYETKHRRPWRIGYRDEQGVERTRGSFLRQGHASDWYRRLEQARSQGRLKGFLDEDAGLLAGRAETLHDFMVDWFRLDAAPELATATAITYLHVYNKHLRPLAGHRSLETFEMPGPVTEVLGQMAAAGVGQATRDRARKVLSSAFGWGVEMGRMRANGARSVRRNRRRSRRLSAAEARPFGHREGAARRKACALAPDAFPALHRGALIGERRVGRAGCPNARRSPSRCSTASDCVRRSSSERRSGSRAGSVSAWRGSLRRPQARPPSRLAA